jgi:release factor glutamine methyltransferase
VAVTVLEAIQKGAEYLGRKNVEPPRLHAELLLAHLLRLPRMKLYLNFDRVLAPGEIEALRELVQRRGRREPLQHIVGSANFCGLELAVNRQALIPRPETELLAELGWEFLRTRPVPTSAEPTPGQTAVPTVGAPSALDFGTGSGCLAIALATNCPAAKIVALDISADALALARQNAAAHQVAARIEFLQGDGLAALTPPHRPRAFDLIVANPPYIPSAEIATLQPEVRDFDPRTALDGGADGLEFYRALARQAGGFLQPDGKMMLEFGDGQADAIRALLEAAGWRVESVREDYSQRARMLVGAFAGAAGEPQPGAA